MPSQETAGWPGFDPEHDNLVGIDSDGCVFDSMEIKQRRHFHPWILRHWGLEQAGPELRETAEFVNLRSKWRGSNRFPALLKTFELFAARPQVRARGIALPDTRALRGYVNSGLPLGHPTLEQEAARTGDPELRRLLDWSRSVNRDISENMPPIPPFEAAREGLLRLRRRSDALVISQTPESALRAEWSQHGLAPFVRAIAGQERGTKTEQLRWASGGRYAAGRVLMIGDAPGDRAAARESGALFFPILPGREEESWRRFVEEGYDRFLSGRFAGSYEERLAAEFDSLLPGRPPWETGDGAG